MAGAACRHSWTRSPVSAPAISEGKRLSDEVAAYQRLRAIWRQSPEQYARDRLGMNPTWQQQKILSAIASPGAKVSVRSGHGTGKTGACAAAVLWFLECHEYPKVPCTAPTSHQLRDVLWAELGKWIRRSDQLSKRRGIPHRLRLSTLFRITTDRLYDPSARGEWFAVARTSSRDNPDALQGFHASDVQISADGTRAADRDEGADGHILFVVDEASGVPDAVYEVAEGALSSPGSRLVLLGNPTRSTGYFANSHRKDRSSFTTIHLKSGESPLVDPQYREKLVKKWGEGSNVVRVRADGDFPKQDDDVLIAFEWCETAIARPAYAGETADIRIGVDPARFGDDRTVLVVRQGRNLLHAEVHAKQGTMTTVGQAINLRQRYNATGIWVGVAGFAGIADRLSELGERVVEVVEGAGAPRKQPGDEFQPINARAAMWYYGMKWMRDEEPSFDGIDQELADDLAGELSAIRFTFDSSGRLKVEAKEDLKRRLGRSPDIADAVLITMMPDRSHQRYATAGDREF